jgi:diguanylate cyclase (GGDEF)-like protein
VTVLTTTRLTDREREALAGELSSIIEKDRAGSGACALWFRVIAMVLDESIEEDELSRTAATLGTTMAEAGSRIESMVKGFSVVRNGLDQRLTELLTGEELHAVLSRIGQKLDDALAASAATFVAILATRARRDAITGLADRTAFDAALLEEIERSKRYATSFTLVLFDLDDFKSVNDRLGHIAGDRVLRAAGETIAGTLRRSDRVFRFGGDEFAAICFGDASTGIARAISRIEGALKNVGISSGTAAFPADAMDATAIIGIADQRMYDCKRSRQRRRETTE